MAATTKSTRKGSTGRNGSPARSSGSSKSTTAKRSTSSAKRTSSNGNRAATKTASKRTGAAAKRNASQRTGASKRTRPRSQAKSTAQSSSGNGSIVDTALDRGKAAGHAVAEVASKARTPLIAGGTAIAGAAAGVLIKDRLAANRLAANQSKNPLTRLRGVSIPNPVANLDLSKVDLDSVKSAAERVSAYGQQASDIAAAVEKTRKKNK